MLAIGRHLTYVRFDIWIYLRGTLPIRDSIQIELHILTRDLIPISCDLTGTKPFSQVYSLYYRLIYRICQEIKHFITLYQFTKFIQNALNLINILVVVNILSLIKLKKC